MAGIYIHIPFCSSKCTYCDFYSGTSHGRIPSFLDALEHEYKMRRAETKNLEISTIYIGGGTPSILSPEQFEALASWLPKKEITEFTVEANPDHINAILTETWARNGVNRVSLGIQSFIDAELKAVGRTHSARRACEAIETLRRNGIDNISIDLIYGLPGQTNESWQESLDKAMIIRPEHISAYCLTVEPKTRLGVMMRKGEFTEATDDDISTRYEALCTTLAANGYEHYEISNFALPQRYSRHNSSYWNSIPYLGLGPAAHSLRADGTRCYNEANLTRYIENPASVLTIDSESETERANDIIFTRLRTARGLELSAFPKKYLSELLENARPLIAGGALKHSDNRLFIEPENWLTSDAVIRELLLD